MSYPDHMREHLRLAVLQALEVAGGYALQLPMLVSGVRAVGVPASGDQVRGAVDWLAEQGLATVENPGVPIARLTQRGAEVAQGHARVTGVARPLP